MNIVNIPVSQVASGMIVAEDVYNSGNERILSRNTMVTTRSITKLKIHAIKEIFVYIPNTLVKKQTIKPSEHITALKNSIEFKKFKKFYVDSILILKDSYLALTGTTSLPYNEIKLLDSVEQLLKECRSSLRTFDMLQCIRDLDDQIYVHSLNVSLICFSFATWLNFNAHDAEQLMLAGLLHDIGKLKLPKDIMQKPTSLNEKELESVHQHPIMGYELVKDRKMDSRVKEAILMHHERCDGSGYPNKLSSKDISPFAKILSIADVYDAMTAKRVYRKEICPFEVLENFEKEGYQKYDVAYLLPFLEGLAQCYINATVCLSNSLVGEVVMINKNNLSRPVVKVDKKFIDLSKHTELKIASIL